MVMVMLVMLVVLAVLVIGVVMVVAWCWWLRAGDKIFVRKNYSRQLYYRYLKLYLQTSYNSEP